MKEMKQCSQCYEPAVYRCRGCDEVYCVYHMQDHAEAKMQKFVNVAVSLQNDCSKCELFLKDQAQKTVHSATKAALDSLSKLSAEELFNNAEFDNLLLNMAAGLKPEDLSEHEVWLIKDSYGDDWKKTLGYDDV